MLSLDETTLKIGGPAMKIMADVVNSYTYRNIISSSALKILGASSKTPLNINEVRPGPSVHEDRCF